MKQEIKAVTRQTQTQRLDRIEEKIDKLSEAMISIARAEERLISIEQHNANQHERMNKFSVKLDELNDKVNDNSRVVGFIQKAFWILLAAIIAATGVNKWM